MRHAAQLLSRSLVLRAAVNREQQSALSCHARRRAPQASALSLNVHHK
jgi:hypothetical protein